MTSDFDRLRRDLQQSVLDASGRLYGCAVGIVTDNKDPDGLGRVKVRFPWLSADEESAWARIATLFAGKERGAFFLPEVDDEVLVAFEHGDPRAPYVLGGLWNGKDVPPDTNANGKNDKRLLTSRSGLRILLDDTSGAEKVEIADKNGELTVTIDVAGKKVTLSSGGDVEISAPQGKVAISGQSIALEASGQALERGDALLLRTGTFDRYGGTEDYTSRYTGLDEACGEWLVERAVKVFGVDSPSPDNPISRTYPIHMMCRARHITHYENLANLDQVSGRRFTFAGFPLRIRGGTGSPVRAVAIVED